MSAGSPCPAGAGVPLAVTAQVPGGFRALFQPALDAILAFWVARAEDVPERSHGAPLAEIEIPVEREPAGRFHLCSVAHWTTGGHRLVHTHRRPPTGLALALAPESLRRISLVDGPNKPTRIPDDLILPAGGVLRWWCVGDAERLRALLAWATHLGRVRGHGYGRVTRWSVNPCEPWPGFPVVHDGQPLRTLPLDWPGVAEDAWRGRQPLTYPYDLFGRAGDCFVPEMPS